MPRDSFRDLRYDFIESDWSKDIVGDIEVIGDENTIAQIVYLRLLIPRGKYTLNPELGSDLYLFKQSKTSEITRRQVQRVVEDALEPEVNAGNIENVNVDLSIDEKDRLLMKVSCDVINGNPLNVNLLLGT